MSANPSQLYSVTLSIRGRVQGVYYRASATTTAQRLGITGYARNMPDGSVQIMAQGTQQQIEQMKQWCWQGPPAAQVVAVEESESMTEIENKQLDQFVVRR